jgi:hypothetical protein
VYSFFVVVDVIGLMCVSPCISSPQCGGRASNDQCERGPTNFSYWFQNKGLYMGIYVNNVSSKLKIYMYVV